MNIRNTKNKGRGVFASKNYNIGETIEDCPVIVLSSMDRKGIEGTNLYNYYFSWGANRDEAAIALGYGSLYNHSYSPNAKYIKQTREGILRIVTYRDIRIGDEIKVNYNEDPSADKEVWFDVKQ